MANRIEPGAESASAAGDAAARASSAAGGGIKAFMPLIITVVLMPVLAYAMTSFVLLPKLKSELGVSLASGDKSAEKVTGKKLNPNARKETVTINKLVVNVAGTMGQRYLLVSLSLVGTDPDFKARVEDARDQFKDFTSGTLCTKTLADLEKPGARNLIRTELISGFNNILGAPMVQEIFLTEFAIQ